MTNGYERRKIRKKESQDGQTVAFSIGGDWKSSMVTLRLFREIRSSTRLEREVFILFMTVFMGTEIVQGVDCPKAWAR